MYKLTDLEFTKDKMEGVKSMKYRLFVTDLDGTLLNSDKKISADNKAALKKLADSGVEVVLASGRHPGLIRGYASELDLSTPIVACNGAIVKDLKTDELVYIDKMSSENILKVVEVARKFKVDYWIYERDGIYYSRESEEVSRYRNRNESRMLAAKVSFMKIDNLEELLENNGGIAKVLLVFAGREEMKYELFDELAKIEDVEPCFSDKVYLDVMNKGVNKKKGIEFYAGKRGINREEIITIGDNDNDIQMLEYAGLGIAMGNATDGAKRISKYISRDCDCSGVSHAVYKIIEGAI